MKKCFLMAAIVAVVSTGAALGASRVTYTLGLGGDNQAGTYENSAGYPQFDTTVGTYTESNGDPFTVGDASPDVTWSAKVAVSGAHNDSVAPSGLANFVFTLELRNAADELVETVVYHSTINDGDDDGFRGQVLMITDPLHWAAFTFIYNINDAGVELAPGRVIDVLENGGPGLTRATYPSKTGEADSLAEPLAVAAPAGTLMGMGAGYPEYIPAELNDSGIAWSDYYFGVGMTDVVGASWSYDGLGVVPLAEGQMNLCGVASGTYTLRLISSKNDQNVSNNIMEGDLDPDYELLGHFAALANEVVESEITFVLTNECAPPPECDDNLDCADGLFCNGVETCNLGTGKCEPGTDPCEEGLVCDEDNDVCVECLVDEQCAEGYVCNEENVCVQACTPPVVLSASSVMRHGGATPATDFAIALATGAPTAVEPRQETAIGEWRLVFVFDQTISITSASVVPSSGSIAGLSLATTTNTNDTLVATLATAPTNNTCWSIAVSGVKDVTGTCTMSAATYYVKVIVGEVNQTSADVDLLDLSTIKGQLFKVITSSNFKTDVRADGSIDLLDLSSTKGNLFKGTGALVCP